MTEQFEPQESDCDAPPYRVVEACKGLGFESPLDVRWCRISHLLDEHSGMFDLGVWAWLLGKKRSVGETCVCGGPLPPLERYTFTFRSERKADYFLGQCWRCHTIYWEQEHQLV